MSSLIPRAADRIRTGDPLLGKQVLDQLSFNRKSSDEDNLLTLSPGYSLHIVAGNRQESC